MYIEYHSRYSLITHNTPLRSMISSNNELCIELNCPEHAGLWREIHDLFIRSWLIPSWLNISHTSSGVIFYGNDAELIPGIVAEFPFPHFSENNDWNMDVIMFSYPAGIIGTTTYIKSIFFNKYAVCLAFATVFPIYLNIRNIISKPCWQIIVFFVRKNRRHSQLVLFVRRRNNVLRVSVCSSPEYGAKVSVYVNEQPCTKPVHCGYSTSVNPDYSLFIVFIIFSTYTAGDSPTKSISEIFVPMQA